jgi:hypothetical protein
MTGAPLSPALAHPSRTPDEHLNAPLTRDLRRPEVGCVRLAQTVLCPVRPKERSLPMSTKFVCFINAHTRKPILVNPDHVRTATEADSHKTVRLVIGEAAEEVEGDLKSVWETLTRTPVDLTWK